MGQAITYALNQRAGLDAYLRDGRVELDNNLCENAIRPLKVGAKNYLFLESARGGELGCVAYTLIENCKRHGLDLRSYLTGGHGSPRQTRPRPRRRADPVSHRQSPPTQESLLTIRATPDFRDPAQRQNRGRLSVAY